MTITEIIIGVTITLCWTLRFVMSKEARLHSYSAEEISLSNSLFMFLGVIGVTTLFWQKEFLPFFAKGQEAVLPFAMSVVKGIFLHLIVTEIGRISKNSMSSATFALTSGLPIGSMIVVFLLGEQISGWDIASVIFIGILGLFYFIKGHGKTLNAEDRKSFFLLMLYITVNMVADKIMGVNQSWAVHLVISNSVWLAIGLSKMHLASASGAKRWSLFKLPLIITGLLYVFAETLLTYSMQNIFNSVVIAFIFMRAAAPITMLIGALRYGEGRWQEQIVFGIAVMASVLVSILL